MEDYTYKDCCCYQCSAHTPHNNPDCACEMSPSYDPQQCAICPKSSWCDVPANPAMYSCLNEV